MTYACCFVLLGRLLTVLGFPGHPPFRSDNAKELTEMILHLEPLPLRKTGNPHALQSHLSQPQASRKDAWLATVPVSRGAQDPNTDPLSAGYRIFLQPSQWRLQGPSKMFTQERPRWEVRTCRSDPLVFTVLIFPGQESAGWQRRLTRSWIIITLFGLVFFRMKWPELLGHPFWKQVRTEEEDPEVLEDSEDEYSEGRYPREAFGSAGSRCVCI